MTVNELIANLSAYVSKSPENGAAEVLLNYDGGICMEFGRADDMHGLMGERCLTFFPNEQGKRIIIREMKRQ